jgi:nucleoside-diphosphate-sugar epimerase
MPKIRGISSKMKIILFGGSGFIGLNLAKFLANRNYDVEIFSRVARSLEYRIVERAWSLQQPTEIETINKACEADVAIHLAHDFSGTYGAKLTVKGTTELIEKLHDLGVARQIFVSSFSSGKHAKSLYGKTKYTIENRILRYPNCTIIRPGLVIGSGGLFGRISKWTNILPLIPMPNGGVDTLPIVDIETLCGEIMKIIENPDNQKQEINLFFEQFASLKDLLSTASNRRGPLPIFITLPIWIFKTCLVAAEFLRIPLPITKDNFLGLIANKNAEHTADLKGGLKGYERK